MTFKEMWNEVPKPLQIMVYAVLGIASAIGFGLLFGWIIVWLWNWLMPMIFGLPVITFWQGVGIFILAKILFGGINAHDDSPKSAKKKNKDKRKREWSFEFDSDKGMGRFGRWEHYDAWWKAEGKDAFERYAQEADADDDDDEAIEMEDEERYKDE